MNSQFTCKNDIKEWLDENLIENYTINDDLTVDVNGCVILYLVYMEQLPVKFGHVKEDFVLGENGLESLKGVPHTVGGDFICGGNIQVDDLTFFPIKICGRIMLTNNLLQSMQSPLKEACHVIWITDRIPDIDYIEKDENGMFKYSIDDYLLWNYQMKHIHNDIEIENFNIL